MTEKTICLLFSLISPILLFSQVEITGKLFNSNAEPITFANVILLSKENKFIEGTITEEDGAYVLKDIEPGSYIIKYQFLGYETKVNQLEISKNFTLQSVTLKEDKEYLDEVVVKGTIPLIERKIDRVIFNVEESVAASGGNAVDALKVTPRLLIRNGRLEMMGKSGMMVMIDGRVKRLEGDELNAFLESIPSDNIKRIEVIANPPAKYSAEGNSGLVNIVLKDGKSDYWSSSIRANIKKASQYSKGIGASYNFNKSNLSLSANLHYTENNTSPEFNSIIFYPESLWNEETVQDVNSEALDNVRLVVDYDFGKVSSGFSYNRYESNINGVGKTTTKIKSSSEALDSLIETYDNGNYSRITNELNYHVIYKIDTTGKELSFDFDFLKYDNKTSNDIMTQTFDAEMNALNSRIQISNNGSQNISNYSASFDMIHPVNKIDLNYGARIVFTNTDNVFRREDVENGDILRDTLVTNKFQLKENTQALYISARKKINDKFDAKVGLRIENTQLEGYSPTLSETNKQKYIEFFPTMYFNYNINEEHSIGVNYGRRISRPSFSYLNPFKWIYSQYSYSEGNPMLRPSFSQNLELEYGYKDRWFATVYYSHLKNGYGRIPFINPDTKIQREIPVNYKTSQMVGLNQNFNFSTFDFIESYLQADIYYNSAKSEIPQQLSYLDSWNGIFSIRNNISLNAEETISLNISYSYFTKGSDGLNENEPFGQLNSGLRFNLLDDSLQLNIYANDILRTASPKYTSFNNNIKYSNQNYYDQQYVRLSLKYDFGGKASGARSRSQNNEEKRRID